MLRWSLHAAGGEGHQYTAVVGVGPEAYVFGGNRDVAAPGHPRRAVWVHTFHGVSLRWSKLRPERCHLAVPSTNQSFTAVLMPHSRCVYAWGGGGPTGDGGTFLSRALYVFRLTTHEWSRPPTSGTRPAGRTGHSACVLGGSMYVHGGTPRTDRTPGTVYRLDSASMVWSAIHAGGPAPPASYGHSATFIGSRMFVFGGCRPDSPSTLVRGVRVFEAAEGAGGGGGCVWLDPPPHAPPRLRHNGRRWGHAAFAHGGRLYVLGGRREEEWYNRALARDDKALWRFDPQSFSLRRLDSVGDYPGPAKTWTLACRLDGERLVLFGSYGYGPDRHYMHILELSPSLKTLCKEAVRRHGAASHRSLPHDVRWELAAMTALEAPASTAIRRKFPGGKRISRSYRGGRLSGRPRTRLH